MSAVIDIYREHINNVTAWCTVEFVYYIPRALEKAEPEPAEDSQKLITSLDNDIRNDALKQRRAKSASLLKKELDTQGKVASREFLVKVRRAGRGKSLGGLLGEPLMYSKC